MPKSNLIWTPEVRLNLKLGIKLVKNPKTVAKRQNFN